jgi:hypothetical protein
MPGDQAVEPAWDPYCPARLVSRLFQAACPGGDDKVCRVAVTVVTGMHSALAPGIARSARRASDSAAARFVARAGLAARGVIYVLVGWVAVLVALGHSSREADQQGALQLLAGKSYGLVLLWLLALGFAGYALWRLSEAALGVTGEQRGAGPRIRSLARAVVYAGFSYVTFTVISGTARSQAGRQEDITAAAMLAVVACGIALVIEGMRKKFMKYLGKAAMTARTRRVVQVLGVTGTIARGVVFALAGVLVVDAAVTHRAAESGGIDKALLTLRDQPFGEFLMLLAALGLLIFGIYGLCEARWRKV